MDELLGGFLAETFEYLEGVETQILQFERNPSEAALVSSIFRLVHTIKGTSSFLGLDRLCAVAHAAESLLGDLRDGAPPTPDSVSAILAALDRIKRILRDIEALGAEPSGDDSELIAQLEAQVTANAGACEPANAAPAVTPPAKGDAGAQPAFGDDGANRSADRRGGARSSDSIRVGVDKIEQIMLLVSELVLNRNQLLEIVRDRESDPISQPLQKLSSLTADLQDAVMRARMQPVGRIFAGLPRLMRELSADLNKKLDLVIEGAQTELDRQLLEVLRDPLTHIVRNCADHGIEPRGERIAAGKPEAGQIRVSASHEAGHITIDIADDGRGLDREAIKARAIAHGLAAEEQLETASDDELFRFILTPGFSTADIVTSVSGRGVGLDVVRANIESIGGTVSLSSVPGKGSRFSLKIPLTLAIAPALIVRAAGARFALPQTSVIEAVGLGSRSRHVVERFQDGLVLRLRDDIVPVIDLASVLGFEVDPAGGTGEPERESEDRLIVIIRIGSATFGLRVESVDDVQEIVVKPLNASVAQSKIFTGQTILGDGSVALILDPEGLGATLGIGKSAEQNPETASAARDDTGNIIRLVLFRAGDGLPKVLPLSLLSRIEMVDADRIRKSDGRFVMRHEGRLMALMPTSPLQTIDDKVHPVLIITTDSRTIGLLVDEIIDIVEADLTVQLPGLTDDLAGTVQIAGEPVELIDVTYYLNAAYSSLYRQQTQTIILADDKPMFTETLTPVLLSAGYRVMTANSVAQLLGLIEQREECDALLIDAGMQLADGGRLAEQLRSLVPQDLPIFLLHEMPAHDVLGLPPADPGMVNLSKLDRQGLLGALASVLAKRDPHAKKAKELAA
jgi:two-component system chemotaxis sensor kinase CheA